MKFRPVFHDAVAVGMFALAAIDPRYWLAPVLLVLYEVGWTIPLHEATHVIVYRYLGHDASVRLYKRTLFGVVPIYGAGECHIPRATYPTVSTPGVVVGDLAPLAIGVPIGLAVASIPPFSAHAAAWALFWAYTFGPSKPDWRSAVTALRGRPPSWCALTESDVVTHTDAEGINVGVVA